MDAEATLRARLAEECPTGLMAHIDRVVALADELARRWGLGVPLARYMAQTHDVARHLGDAEWLRRAEAYGIPIDPVEREAPVLLHGPVGAEELRRRFDVTDERVLHAVWWHTPGHPDYPDEAWAMFVSDKVEPDKVRDWPALDDVRRLALDVGLKPAALRYLDLRMEEAAREGYPVQPQLLATREYLVGEVRG